MFPTSAQDLQTLLCSPFQSMGTRRPQHADGRQCGHPRKGFNPWEPGCSQRWRVNSCMTRTSFNPWGRGSPQQRDGLVTLNPVVVSIRGGAKSPTCSSRSFQMPRLFQSMGGVEAPNVRPRSESGSHHRFNPWGRGSPQRQSCRDEFCRGRFNPWGRGSPQPVMCKGTLGWTPFQSAGAKIPPNHECRERLPGIRVSIRGGGDGREGPAAPDRSKHHLLLTIFLKASLNSR